MSSKDKNKNNNKKKTETKEISPDSRAYNLHVSKHNSSNLSTHFTKATKYIIYLSKLASNFHDHKFLITVLIISSDQTINLNISKDRMQSFIGNSLGPGHSFSHLFIRLILIKMYHVPKSILVSNLLVNKTYQPLMAGILHGERWDWRKQVRLKPTAKSAETNRSKQPRSGRNNVR